jgi:MYXO-CTERM domain-containing protein
MRMRACLIAAVLFVAPFSAWAQSVAYGVAYDELYRIDLNTRIATYVGTAGDYAGTPLAALTGLSYGPGNELYAVAGNRKSLVRIDRANGSASFVGDFGLAGQGQGQFNALDLSMTYGCDGSFWMASAITRDLWRVNAQTAALTLIGSTGRQITGLAMRNGVLYGTATGGDQGLYRINTQTAAATRVGSFSGEIPWIDPSFDAAGTLWATFSYNPPFNREWSDLARISATDGSATNLGPITGPDRLRYLSIKGLAVAPTSCVPENPDGGPTEPAQLPVDSRWALLLLGVLLLLAGRSRMTRRRV